MKKRFEKVRLLSLSSTFCAFCVMLALTACGGTKSSEEKAEAATDDADFYATQPVQSGLYDASYYDITGPNARKGHFDGRIYFSLSPATSAFYVFENGNRTKMDYLVNLEAPFVRNDTCYATIDKKGREVSIVADSVGMVLKFQRSGEDVAITFNPKPRHTGSALEILEKIASVRDKK